MKKISMVMKSIILIVILNPILNAQKPGIMWMRTYGLSSFDVGNSVQQTSDGGYIIAGETQSPGAGDSDVWLIKTNDIGDTLWTRTYGGSGNDIGYSVQQTSESGYVITGVFSVAGGIPDLWLFKTNPNGDILWSKTYSGIINDVGYSIQQTSDGGYVMTGYTGYGIWLLRTNANGDTLWARAYNSGSIDKGGRSVQQTSDGGFILVGSKPDFSNNTYDLWLIKTDANGNTVLNKTLDMSDLDLGYSVHQTSDDGYIIAGETQSGGVGNSDVWLIKTNANGDTLWTKTFGGPGEDSGHSVQKTSDGGYIIGGWTESFGAGSSDVWLIKTDANGDSLWTQTFGGNDLDYGRSIQQTSDGGYIISGHTRSFGAGEFDVLLIKVSPDVTSIPANPQTPVSNYQLQQNYPNPFNPTTNIEFSIPKSEFVTLTVYNILGEEVATLVSEKLVAGKYKYDWDASSLASGVYLYKIQAGDYVEAKKMVLLR